MWIAVTKILARKGPLADGIGYILNEEKTDQLVTIHMNCDPGWEVQEMLDTKRAAGPNGKMDGVQYYHIVQSFKPGEVTPELALEIAKEFTEEHLPGYEAVIVVHVDKEHIHAHTIFNSVNADTGRKYHSNAKSYYSQIRAVSDRLCREHGSSVIMEGQSSKAVSYIEWLRQSKGQPTFRSMLEANLRTAIEDANDLGHFFLLMEHMGWEIIHGNRLGFRLRGQPRPSGTGLGRPGGNMPGQEHFMVPGRKTRYSRRTVSGPLFWGTCRLSRQGVSRPRPIVSRISPTKSTRNIPDFWRYMSIIYMFLARLKSGSIHPG